MRCCLLDVLFTPVIYRNRQSLVFDRLLPFIPEIDRAAIRFVYGLIDPDSAWQQARIANNQSFACIEGRQNVAETTKAIGKKSLDNALIFGVGQPHGYEVAVTSSWLVQIYNGQALPAALL